MVTISTTPDLPPGVPTWTGERRATPEPTVAGDAGADDGEDWLVGDEDVAGRAAPPQTRAVPTLVVTRPPPVVIAPDPTGHLHKHHRRPSTERVVSWSSAIVGAGGILLGLMLALVNVEKWPEKGVCKTYKAVHHGHGAFGCGGTRGLATVLPPVVTALLVVVILAVVWIPHHTARRRLELIAGLAALLVATALVEALVYAALP